MNPLAADLNRTLEGTVAAGLLSDFGRRFYFPKGIVAQSAEAKQHARRFNATIGLATEGGEPMYLPSTRQRISGLSPEQIFSYAPTAGLPELREIWKREMVQKNPALEGVLTSQPVVVTGLTHGISILADLFADAGDPVLVPDMFWGNYRLIFEERRQAVIRSFSFFNSAGGLDLEALDRSLQEVRGAKAILMLNFPNNPTGYSPSRDEARQVVDLLRRHAEAGTRILAVLDDAYFGLFFEKETYPHSLFGDLAGLHENILAAKVDGATKEELVWGFRVGFLTFASRALTAEHHEALTRKVMGAIRASVSNSNQLTQNLILEAMKSPSYPSEKQEAFRKLEDRYRTVRRIVDRVPPAARLRTLPFNSGYFMTFACEGGSAEELRRHLLMEEGVGTISIQEKYLRVAFCSVDKEHLEELYRVIFRAAEKLAAGG